MGGGLGRQWRAVSQYKLSWLCEIVQSFSISHFTVPFSFIPRFVYFYVQFIIFLSCIDYKSFLFSFSQACNTPAPYYYFFCSTLSPVQPCAPSLSRPISNRRFELSVPSFLRDGNFVLRLPRFAHNKPGRYDDNIITIRY